MDMTLFTAASANLNAGLQIAKTLLSMKVGAEVVAKTNELQGVLASAMGQVLELQSALHVQHARVRELEAQIARHVDFDAQAKRYELKSVSEGALTYALKAGAENGEPEHWLCVHCFERRERSILLYARPTLGRRIYACPTCKTEISVSVPAAGVTIDAARARRSIFERNA